jgi:hypothetical protein
MVAKIPEEVLLSTLKTKRTFNQSPRNMDSMLLKQTIEARLTKEKPERLFRDRAHNSDKLDKGMKFLVFLAAVGA